MAVANQDSNTMSILFGIGDSLGSFYAKTDYPVGTTPWGIAIGDLNSDGKRDVAVTSTNGVVSVMMNTGNGAFAAKADYPIGSTARSSGSGCRASGGRRDKMLMRSIPPVS